MCIRDSIQRLCSRSHDALGSGTMASIKNYVKAMGEDHIFQGTKMRVVPKPSDPFDKILVKQVSIKNYSSCVNVPSPRNSAS